MSFRYSSSISSEDQFIDRRLRSYRNPDYLPQIDSANRHGEFRHYSKSKRRNKSKLFDIKRDFIFESSDTDTEDEVGNIYGSSSRRNHSANDVYQACQVTIQYTNHSSSSTKIDQILIKQKQNNDDQSVIVYKGYLKSGEIFSFKSQHLSKYPFDIQFYVNGYFQTDLLTCCEYKYRRGGFRLNHLFTIQQIEKSFPCQKCRKHQHEEIVETKHKIKSEEKLNNTNEEQTNHFQSNDEKDQKEEEEEENETSKFENNSSNMLVERTTTGDNTNRGNFLQSLLAYLQHGLRRMPVREPLPPRHQGNVENFVVLILGITDQTNLIGSIFNFVKIFSNIEELNAFVSTLKVEKTILILNDSFCESIEDYSRFDSIYILSNQLKFHHPNLRGIYPNLKLLSSKLVEEFSNETNLFSIESVSSIETENQSFTYSQLLKETILTKDNEDGLFNRLINKLNRIHFSKTVYRIIHLPAEKFDKFKENSNGLISFGTFLDCSLTKPSSIEYLNDMKTILFEIKTTNGIEIKQIRHKDSNIEILLSFDNIYQIESIEQIDEHYSIIHLILIDKENEQFKQLTNEIRSEIQGPVILIQLSKLLIQNNDYLHADYFARLLFDDNSLKDNPTLLASLAAVHHLLGSQDHRQNNHRAARLQFEQSLKIFLTFIPEDNQILSATYNNIGSMFYQEDQHDQAIIYHQKALQCQLKASSPDIEAIATYSGNIGAVYLDQKKYDEALANYKRSLHILQQSTPGGESQSIAMVYDRIASIYWRMDKPEEALPFYQKALQLELKFLPENDHKISVSYFNLSTAYAKLNQLDDAIDCAEKSIQQLLKSVPPDHPEVKENTEQLEGLRRKKWLQQLYQ